VVDWCCKYPDAYIVVFITFSCTAIGVKNRIIKGCKCQVLLSKAASNNFYLSVALTAGELVGPFMVVFIGVTCKWNLMGKLCEYDVVAKIFKK
jgi:hypothetical protein